VAADGLKPGQEAVVSQLTRRSPEQLRHLEAIGLWPAMSWFPRARRIETEDSMRWQGIGWPAVFAVGLALLTAALLGCKPESLTANRRPPWGRTGSPRRSRTWRSCRASSTRPGPTTAGFRGRI
jgi:hypothetical protein